MDDSFKLKATMSPQPLQTKVHIKKPTKLSLRKNIRRSSIYGKPPAALVNIGKEHLEDSSSEVEFKSAESNFDESCVMFADLSIIPKETAMTAMNSTFIEGRHTQFHELFKGSNKNKNANPHSIHPKTDMLEEVRKVLDDAYGPSLRKNENEILRTEPRKKVSKRINEIHKAVCLTETRKLNCQKGGDQRNLVKNCNGKNLFSRLSENPPTRKSGELYCEGLESDSKNELILKMNFIEIDNAKKSKLSSLTENSKNSTKQDSIQSNSRSQQKDSFSSPTEIKSCADIEGSNNKQHFIEHSETSSSEDEISKRKYKRIVKTKATEVRSLKRNKNTQDNIKGNGRNLENANCLRRTETNKSKELSTGSDADSEVVVISDSEDDEQVRKYNIKGRFMEKSNNIVKESYSTKNEPIKAQSNENIDENVLDNLNGIRKVLDELYGSSWREREHEVIRTEPRKKVSTKADNLYNTLIRTDIKGIGSNKENMPDNANINLINSGNPPNIYTESPVPKCSTSLKHLQRRKLFPSVDAEDEDYNEDLGQSALIKRSNYIVKAPKTPLLKASTDKKSAKTIGKYSWVKDLCSDSEAESVDAVVSSESDWESPQDDYLPKYMKPIEVKCSVQKKQKTFLESLSKNVPILEAHGAARIFRNDFKKHRDKLTSRLFELFNKDVFGGVIPTDTLINWNPRLRGTAGYCRNKSITHRDKKVTRTVAISLSNKVLDSPDRLRDTLIHEMCHAANWIVDGQRGHGPSWRNWTIKARNVFPELPSMNTCHSYNIATKYTYRCQGCGYSFGRHSKSISIEKKCCGYCKGKLELLVNKVSKTGSTNSTPVPATPTRNPSGFALFVKDNYKNCRTPDLKHGDVMRLLSKQFSSLKVERTNSLDK